MFGQRPLQGVGAGVGAGVAADDGEGAESGIGSLLCGVCSLLCGVCSLLCGVCSLPSAREYVDFILLVYPDLI